MALIICHSCGKSISDTSSHCIHCGVPTAPEAVPEKTETAEAPRLTSFNGLPPKTAFLLDKEFKEKCSPIDPWLKQHLSILYDMLHLCATAFCVFTGIFLGRNLAYKIFDFLDNPVYLPFLETIHDFSKTCAIGLTLGVLGIYLMHYIRLRISHANLIYKKKFQRWLLEEKQIEYIIPFKTVRAKEKFDAIDLDNI